MRPKRIVPALLAPLLLFAGCSNGAAGTPVTAAAPVTTTVQGPTTTAPGPTTTVLSTLVTTRRETTTVTIEVTASPTQPSVPTFDRKKVEAGVLRILTSAPPTGYGLKGVTSATCPTGQPVKAGGTFECTAVINGSRKIIEIVVKDANGRYEVAPPS
jgi:hypothetical protein